MKAQGVTRVINLLDSAKEIQKGYSCDLPTIMTQEFTEFHNISVSTPGMPDRTQMTGIAPGSPDTTLTPRWGAKWGRVVHVQATPTTACNSLRSIHIVIAVLSCVQRIAVLSKFRHWC